MDEGGTDGINFIIQKDETMAIRYRILCLIFLYWMIFFTNQKSKNDYIEFLKFIYNELPNSIPITYDLAYWMNKPGNKEEAKKLYQKYIQLNPEHHHAKMRLDLIELEENRQ